MSVFICSISALSSDTCNINLDGKDTQTINRKMLYLSWNDSSPAQPVDMGAGPRVRPFDGRSTAYQSDVTR